ncbi:unnamed protein product [Effrenium voratum]|nr:unnamed protein product [Effrenium voratum]
MLSSVRGPAEHGLAEAGPAEDSDSQPEEPVDVTTSPLHVERTCTDVWFLLVFLAVSAGVGWLSATNVIGAHISNLKFGHVTHLQTCKDEETFIFWCLNSTSDGLLRSHPLCVHACPVSESTSHMCHEPITGKTVQTQDYPSHPLGYFCKPYYPELMQQVDDIFARQRGMLLRVFGLIYRDSVVMLAALVLAVVIGYFFVFSIFLNPTLVVEWTLFILTALPCCSGVYTLFSVWQAGTAWDIYSYIETESPYLEHQKIAIGVIALFVGITIHCVAHHYRSRIESMTHCMQAVGDCMLEEWTILLVPFVSITLQALVTSGCAYVCACLAAQTRAKAVVLNPEGPDHIDWKGQALVELIVIVCYMVWCQQAVYSGARCVTAYLTEVWYFTTPSDDGSRGRECGCILGKAVAEVVFFHSGSIFLGAFLAAFFRAPAEVARLIVRCGYADKILERFQSLVRGTAATFVYSDIAMSSDSFLSGAERAAEALEGHINNIKNLQGALWIFHLAGAGICAAGCAYFLSLIITIVPSFSNPASDLFVWEPHSVMIANGLIGLLVGHCIMLGFDTVFDTILYCYTIEVHRRRKLAEVRAIRGAEQNDVFSWFLPVESSDEEMDIVQHSFLPSSMGTVLERHNHFNGSPSSPARSPPRNQ